MYKILHIHITPEAMTTAHYLATLRAKYDVLTSPDFRSVKYTINGATEQVREKGALIEFCSHMITVNCSCIINLIYEVIKLAMCGSHGVSSDVFKKSFVHGDLFHYFLTIFWPFLFFHVFKFL